MIRWNGKRYVPAGVKPLMNRKGVNVPGMPKTKWIASWVGGESELECDFTYEILVTPTPTPTSSITPTITPTSSITPTPSITPTLTPTSSITPTPTPSSSTPSLDPDAAAYLTDVISAGGTTNPTIESAVDTLFTSLKSAGLYSKMSVFYPFVGGTAASHSIMGDRTSGTTYDLTYVGGVTHGVSGTTGNLVNGGVNTNYPADSQPTDRHFSVYANRGPDVNSNGYECGGGNGSTNMCSIQFASGLGYVGHGQLQGYSPITYPPNRTSFITSSISGTTVNSYKNEGKFIGPVTRTNFDGGNRYLSILCDNRSNVPGFNLSGAQSEKTVCWYNVGDALTDSEMATFQGIINTFQTSLGRNTY